MRALGSQPPPPAPGWRGGPDKAYPGIRLAIVARACRASKIPAIPEAAVAHPENALAQGRGRRLRRRTLVAERRSDRWLDKGVGHVMGNGVSGPPAGAVGRHDLLEAHCLYVGHGRRDDRLEESPRQV